MSSNRNPAGNRIRNSWRNRSKNGPRSSTSIDELLLSSSVLNDYRNLGPRVN